MLTILSTLTPAFTLVLLGFICTKIGYFKVTWSDGLISFVQKIAVPCLLFTVMAKFSLSNLYQPLTLAAFYLGCLINFAAVIVTFSTLFTRSKESASVLTFGGTFSNSVLLGIPLAISVFGLEGSIPVYIIIAFHTPVLTLALSLLIGIFREKHIHQTRLGSITRELFTNPIVIALIAGVLYNISGFPLHQQVSTLLNDIAAVTSTTALFAIGSGLCRFSLKHSVNEIIVLSILKLIVFPTTVAVLCWLLAVPKDLSKISIFMASLPTGVTAYIMAHYYNKELAVTSGTILLTTFASAFTIPLVLYIFDYVVQG